MSCFGNGKLVFNPTYNPAYWDDLRISATSATTGGALDPTFAQFRDDGAGSTGVFTWQFPQNLDRELFFEAQMPHKWLEGSDIKPHVHWAPDTAGSGNVVWGLEYTVARAFTVFPITSTLSVTAAAPGVAYQHTINGFGSISMVGNTISTMLLCRIYREGTNVADTYGSDASLLEVDFHYQLDTPGSVQEFSK